MPVRTDLPLRAVTPAELHTLYQRFLSLARPGAPAAELAEAAYEYFFYHTLNQDPQFRVAPRQASKPGQMHMLSHTEASRALVQFQRHRADVPVHTHQHNRAINPSLAMMVHHRPAQ